MSDLGQLNQDLPFINSASLVDQLDKNQSERDFRRQNAKYHLK